MKQGLKQRLREVERWTAEKGEVWGIAAEGKLKMIEVFLIVKSFVL